MGVSAPAQLIRTAVQIIALAGLPNRPHSPRKTHHSTPSEHPHPGEPANLLLAANPAVAAAAAPVISP